MPSVERYLISKILQTKDMTEVIENGITPKFFLDPDHREAFKAIIAHQSKYSTVPSVETFRRDYPTYRLPDAEEPTSYYVDEIREEYKRYRLDIGLAEVLDLFDANDNDGVLHKMSQMQAEIISDVSRSRVVDITQTGEQRLERYKAYQNRDEFSLRGIPTGFDFLDQLTQGWQPQQLVTFVGPPGAGKSTMMLLSMMAAHRAVRSPLFIGFEMTNEEQEERHDAIRSRISHRKLRSGELTKDDFAHLEKMMRRNESMPPMIFSEDADSTLTVAGIAAQVDRYKPPVVYVDGTYLMDDDHGENKGSPQALTNISRGLKQLAKNKNITVVQSTQVLLQKMDRKKGVTQGSIGYTSAFLQDSTYLLGVQSTDDDDIKLIKELKARDHKLSEVYMQWDWETGKFEELEDYEEGQTYNAPITF